ncbi:MAG: hypothetical protein J0H82_34590 [Alphaproteobacteria bacterium]|jgi:hypothetical protein|nr:hypothetical protein [Alphaproteobacteria bacterium]
MLDLIWDVVSGSAFMRWFLLGALAGLILSILAYLIGLPIYGEHALLAIAGGGLLSVLGRLGVWVARR